MSQTVRYTELSNPLTTTLGESRSLEALRMLRQVDSQLFHGYRTAPFIPDLTACVNHLQRLFEAHASGKERLLVVMSGCGTSGRVAWLCAKTLSAILISCQPELDKTFKYLISGGDQSLVISNELPEDDPHQGRADLLAISEGYSHVVFVGITCGLSAPYVAGQIEYSMSQAHFTTMLIGFNPVHLARDAPVENWSHTCRSMFVELEKRSQQDNSRCFVINPVVGGEAVTGSSRMKGGSMTLILLEIIFVSAIAPICGISPYPKSTATTTATPSSNPSSSPQTFDMLGLYESAYRHAYRSIDELAPLIDLIGHNLLHSDGHLYYLGSNTFGLLGLIDASEMVDTYGGRIDEVRAFIDGGWDIFESNEENVESLGPLFKLSLTDFASDILPTLGPHDVVVLLNLDNTPSNTQLVEQIKSTQAYMAAFTFLARGDVMSLPRLITGQGDARFNGGSIVVRLEHASLTPCDVLYAEFAAKLLLNATTTLANAIKGRIVGNTMVNLTVANNKLFQRSSEIVAQVSKVTVDVAAESLLKAIHHVDALTNEQQQLPLSRHIELATPQTSIVPTAILISTGKYSYATARAALAGSVPLRELLQKALHA